jgi:SpoIID/LytB domain protein
VASLFQPNDLPEFYRWSRFVSAEEMAKAIAAQFKTKMAVATEIRVVERAPSGHIKKLAIVGLPQPPILKPQVVPATATPVSNSPDSNPQTPAANLQPPTTAAPAPATTPQAPVTVMLKGDSQIRSMLTGRMGSTTALPSSTFVALPQKDANGTITGWILKGAGWGHGVGLCQRGAQNHALEGWDYKRILQHYFTGVELRKM